MQTLASDRSSFLWPWNIKVEPLWILHKYEIIKNVNSFRLRLNRVVAQFYAICILFYSNWSDPEDCRGSWVFPRSDSIQLFFLKMQIKRGNRAGRFRRTRQVAIASTSPFKLSKFGKRLLKMKWNLCKWKNYIRVHFSQDACIYSNICTYIYLVRVYRWTRRVWSELFEKWCGRLVEWIWKSDLLPVRRYSIIPAFVSLLSSILRLRGRVWKIAGNLFSRSHVRSVVAGKSKIDRWPIIRLQITSRLDTSADETDQSATPLSLGSIYRRAGRE